MATTRTLEPAQYSSGPYRVEHKTDAASETYLAGQFVYMHTDGTIKACADDATTIYGMAMHDATTVTGAATAIILAQVGTYFRMNIYHSSIGSAVAALASLDEKWGLEVDSNRCYVDLGQAGADAFMIGKFIDAVGDTYALCEATVLPEVIQVGATGA